jgi:trimethylamine:corrinoid methyltransferase-like protein
VGVVVDSKEARDIFLENGAQFDEKTGFVKFHFFYII